MHDLPVAVLSMKRGTHAAARAIALTVADDTGRLIASLVPVGRWALGDASLIEQVCAWRARNMRMFLTQFASSADSTRNYLERLAIGDPRRLLFIIEGPDSVALGHIGLIELSRTSAEIDNVMRGDAPVPPRLMYLAQRRLLQWCFDALRLDYCTIRVLSYNSHAIDLYIRLGFSPRGKIHLFRDETNGLITHKPCAPQQSNVDYWCDELVIQRPVDTTQQQRLPSPLS
ncbi:hypothetical protein GALL_277440 [mine drainage metagenome]|uniref:N-acetyltransferase domain-containing protein n=1 Tax=mine drainage metagenome TaxID=410659 RepID=A0A1J5R309_9ZZZZ